MNLDHAIDQVRNAFVRHDGKLTRDEFDCACRSGGATRQDERDAVQACLEAGGLRVVRNYAVRRLSTDLLIYDGWRAK